MAVANRQFRVRYIDVTRQSVREELAAAESEARLRSDWTAAGRVVLAVNAVGVGVRSVASRPGDFDVAWWCREMGTLLRAGMTAVEALETLMLQSASGRRRAVHAALLQRLHEGRSLSKAMQEVGAFPDVLVAGVTASERTGTLSDALQDYLHYDELLQRLRRQAVSAAIYPSVVVLLGGAVMVFLLVYVIPRVAGMLDGFRGSVSLPTQWLIALSGVVHDHLPVIAMVLAATALALAWAWVRGNPQRLALRLLQSVGPLDRQWDHYRYAKLYQSLALMFKGGYTLDEALDVCTGLGLGPRIADAVRRARASLARGRPVAASMAAAGLTEAVSERLLAVGERTGEFDAVLRVIATRHAEAFATFVERATRIVEPVLLLLVALLVGGVVVMMYMPIFDIAGAIR